MRTRANTQNLVVASVVLVALVIIALLLPSAAQAQLDGTAPAPVTPIPPLRVDTVRNEFVNTEVVDDVVVVNIPGVECRELPTEMVNDIDSPVPIPLGVITAVDKQLFPVFMCQGQNTYGIGFFLYEQDSEYVFQINVYDQTNFLLNDDVLIVVRPDNTKLSLNPF